MSTAADARRRDRSAWRGQTVDASAPASPPPWSRGRGAGRRSSGGRAGTASSRCTTSTSRSPTPTGRSTAGTAGSASAPSSSTRRPTRTARRSRSSSTAQPVFARGVNWIPDDAFPPRVDPRALRRAARPGPRRRTSTCSGSGAAASTRATTSTTICDELGLLVWQDFLFACAAYTEEEPLRGEVDRRGPRERHPAEPRTRAWCCGTAATRTSGATRTGAGRSRSPAAAGAAATTARSCPAIVAELDPTRPYTPGQPVLASRPTATRTTRRTARCTSGTSGTSVDYTAYRDYSPRFVAEFGFQGPPTWATLTRAIHDEPLHARLARHAARTRRPTTATASSTAGPAPAPAGADDVRRLALGDVAQPGPGRRASASSTSARWPRSAWAPSSGSSTTAGR